MWCTMTKSEERKSFWAGLLVAAGWMILFVLLAVAL